MIESKAIGLILFPLDLLETASIKNLRPGDVALFGALWKGAKGQSSAPWVVGVMEYGSNGLKLREGF
jgi:hypothetical protein